MQGTSRDPLEFAQLPQIVVMGRCVGYVVVSWEVCVQNGLGVFPRTLAWICPRVGVCSLISGRFRSMVCRPNLVRVRSVC